MRKAVINGTEYLIEMDWQFLSNNQVESRMSDDGGVVIRHSAAVQFGQGNGESGLVSLAAWVADMVPDGLTIMPLGADHCWLCGTIGGFIAPETDKVFNKVDLPRRLELLEDIVPYDLYMIDSDFVECEGIEAAADKDALLADVEVDGIKHLELGGLKDAHRVSAKKVREPTRFNPIYYAVIGLALITSAYLGYNWWQQQQEQQQSEQLAVDQQLQQLAQIRQQRSLANSYRSLHQPTNYLVAVKGVLAGIELESRGWDLQKVEIGELIKASYKRKEGLLADFLTGRSDVTWSEDGNGADLDLGKFEVPVPMRSPNLKTMNRVEAITMMQRLKKLGIDGSLIAGEPAWAASVPRYPVGSGVDLIFWRAQASLGWLESAMAFLQQRSVAVAAISFDFGARNCEIEGVIYAKNS